MNNSYSFSKPQTPESPRRRVYNFVPKTPTAKTPVPPNLRRFKFTSNVSSITSGDFGKDAIKITIGNRPLEFKPPFPNPGPSDYQPRDVSSSRKIYHTFERSKPRSNPATLTSNIGFITPPKEQLVPITIPKSERPPLYNATDTPGFIYEIPHGLSTKSHKISGHIESSFRGDDSNAKLGPGYYSPTYNLFPISCTPNLSSDPKRGEWMIAPSGPAPGQYSPKYIQVNEPSYAIGRKSRPSRRNPPKNNTKLFAIDAFIINLPKTFEERDVLRYFTEEPEVREFIHEISDLVLVNKPDDPIGFIRNYYSQFKPAKEDLSRIKKNIDMF